MLEVIAADNTEDGYIPSILNAMDADVIDALLSNTFAWRFKCESGFRAKMLPIDNCMGVYVVAVAVRGQNGLGLCIEEWKKILEMMEKYFAPSLCLARSANRI